MDDSKIIDLYWQRDEKAIEETDSKYGAYCLRGVDEHSRSARGRGGVRQRYIRPCMERYAA